jgi:plastocyanin
MRIGRAVCVGTLMVAAAAGFSVGARPAAADTDMQVDGATCTWGVALSISAQDNKFDRDCLSSPPGEEFTIVFENRDPVAHNIAILRAHDSTETLFRGEVLVGSGSVTYAVGRLQMGTYHFHCDVHPDVMMGKFVTGGTGAIVAPGGMTMSSPGGAMTASPLPKGRTGATGLGTLRSLLLVPGIAFGIGGLVYLSRSRRRARNAAVQPETVGAPTAPAASHVGRRELVKLGAAGVAGAVAAKMATSEPAGAGERLGGIHISALTEVVTEAGKGFPHHWTLTVYGPDDALNGMGWGGATDLKTAQDVFNSKMFPCIFSLTGAVEGDLVKLHGLMLFSGAPDQGLPQTFEGNLKTGVLRVNAYNTFDFEGKGIVARI